MAIKRHHFRVWMVGEDDEDGDGQLVIVTHGDMLRAELEGPKHGLESAKAAPMHYATLWVWASMVRTHQTATRFRDFVDLLLDMRSENTDDADPGEPVDPTLADTRSASDSSSLHTSAAASSGSTLT